MVELTSLSTLPAFYIKRTNIQPEDLDEDILMDFANDAVQKIVTDKTSEHIVALLPVTNYNAPKPPGCRKFVEAAYKNEDFNKTRLMYHDEVISWMGENFKGCDVKVSIECARCHEETPCNCNDNSVVIKADDDWLRANVERQYWNNPFYRGAYGLNKENGLSSFYHPEFSLMRPKRHRFHGVDWHVKGCMNLSKKLKADWPVEYLVDPIKKKIRVNVESGTILLSYLAVPKDEYGYPLAPDDIEAFEGIFWYARAWMLHRDIDKKKQNYQLFNDALARSEQLLSRAKRKLDALNPAEWNAIMRDYQKGVRYRPGAQASRLLSDKFDRSLRGFNE